MPEIGPETKPEAKQGEKPSEAKPEGKPDTVSQEAKGSRKYVDYDNVSPQEAAVMLKRIRKRVGRIMRDIDAIMAILKYGANAGPQGQGEGQENQGYQGRSSGYRNYRRNYGYNKYGGRRYNRSQRRRNEEDVNYE
jgi:hypothetical protein